MNSDLTPFRSIESIANIYASFYTEIKEKKRKSKLVDITRKMVLIKKQASSFPIFCHPA